MFEAQDLSLVFIPKLLRPLCLSRLCHIDTFLTLRYWRPEEMTVFSSARTIWDYLFLFLSLVSVLPPNLKKAAFKRQTVKTLYGLQTLYLKMEVNLKCWNEVYLLKIFYWGSERDLEQSTVYVTYLIQESRSLDKPCFRTSQSTEKCSKQPTKLLYWFHLYCMEIKTNLLGLWFTVLVCTRCCLQKKVGKKKLKT